MFFRNLSLFRFSPATSSDLSNVETALDQHRLRPCGPIEMMTRGFVSPFGRDSDELVHRAGDFTLFTVGGEDKLLPSSVVNDELANKLAEITEIFVEADVRDVGVGESLMGAITEWAVEHDCEGIDARALPGDRNTKNFFESFGLVARAITVHKDLRTP